MSKAHAASVLAALDFYVRILIGQYNNLLWGLRDDPLDDSAASREALSRTLLMIRHKILPDIDSLGLSGSYGIYSRERDVRAGEAYNIMLELRYHLAWLNSPEGGSSGEFEPPLWAADDPYPHPHAFFFVDAKGEGAVNVKLCREQLQIIIDALGMYAGYLHYQFQDVFRYLTDDKEVLETAKQVGDARKFSVCESTLASREKWAKHIAEIAEELRRQDTGKGENHDRY